MSVRILPLTVTSTFFNLIAISALVAAQSPASARAKAEKDVVAGQA